MSAPDRIRVHPVGHQRRDPFRPSGLGGPDQLVGQHLLGRLLRRTQPAAPRPAVTLAQSVGKQQVQVLVGCLEHPVVQRLAVVRIGPGIEQHPSQRHSVLVRGLVGPILAPTEGPGQRGEGRRQSLPEETGVRVGAGVEQPAGAAQTGPIGRGVRDPAVAQVQQRRPLVRPTLGDGRRGVRGDELAKREHRPGGGRGEDVRPGELGAVRQESGGPARSNSVVGPVGETGEPQQLIGWVGLMVQPMRVATPGLDQPQVLAQLGPAGEAVRPSQRELRVGQPKLARVGGELFAARMQLSQQAEGLRVAGSALAQPVLGLLAQLAQVGTGQSHSSHRSLQSSSVWSRSSDQDGGGGLYAVR